MTPNTGQARSRRPERPDTPGFVDDYLPYLLARASALISGEFHHALARQRVAVIDWRILASLWENETLTMTHLAQRVVLKQPTCSRAVSRMVDRGLVRRIQPVADRRSVQVSLTARGRALARPLIDAARRHERSVRDPLGAERERVLTQALRQLIRDHTPTIAGR